MMVRFILSCLCMCIGIFMEVSAVIGVFRFKYALNRLHTAALGDTMGLFFVLLSLMICVGLSFTALKLAMLVVMFWIASPVSSHMIARLELETYEELEQEVTVWMR